MFKVSEPMIELHAAECLATLKDVSLRLSGPERKSFPQRYACHLWHSLGNRPVPAECLDRQGNNHAIRQIHDFYGWMAKSGRNGHCAGAIYRTEEFMARPAAERNGTRHVRTGRNIHIEHTVPVSVLADQIGRAHV